MRFVDYKCKDCRSVSEIVIRGEDGCQIKCEKCGSKNMIRVFSPVGFKSSSSCSSCTSRSCATCSGGNL